MPNRIIESQRHDPLGSTAILLRWLAVLGVAGAVVTSAAWVLFIRRLGLEFGWRDWVAITLGAPVGYVTAAAFLAIAAVMVTTLIHLRRALHDDVRTLRPTLRRRLHPPTR